jgi:hypothetical protein
MPGLADGRFKKPSVAAHCGSLEVVVGLIPHPRQKATGKRLRRSLARDIMASLPKARERRQPKCHAVHLACKGEPSS